MSTASTVSSSASSPSTSPTVSCCSSQLHMLHLEDAAATANAERAKALLSVKQIERLRRVLADDIEVHGLANFPSITIQLRQLILAVHARLAEHKIHLVSTKLNGGAASHIMATTKHFPFSDLDLIFNVRLGDGAGAVDFERIRSAVLDALLSLLPANTRREKIDRNTVKEVYIRKMVKVNETADRWSLFTLNNNYGKCVELKFVDRMRRQFEFSVDSFQLLLDPLLADPDAHHVEVPAESMYGDFKTALRHLNERLIDTRRPEEIRGGGLLKYCHLLARGYQPAKPWRCRLMERYMCSRFFIDFADVCSQEHKLLNYLQSHLGPNEQNSQSDYLQLLHQIVADSTVCLMQHERRQTLAMIQRLMYQAQANTYYEQACCPASGGCGHTPRQTLLYLPRNATYWIPVV